MRKTGKWTIAFFNPGKRPAGDTLFGCGSLGGITAERSYAPYEDALMVWKEGVSGTVVCGGAEDCLRELAEWEGSASLAIILLAQGAGAEDFLARFHEILPETQIAGGVSACLPGERGELLPENGDVSILLMEGDCYKPIAQNILRDTGRRFAIQTGAHPRDISALMTGGGSCHSALADWRELQLEYGVPCENFECLTLSNPDGVNIHMHTEDKRLLSGANCREDVRYTLRFATHGDIDDGAQAFAKRPGSLIFGCAGLKGAMRRLPSVPPGNLAVFLFGEIAFGQFGNLMMTGITAS